MIIIYGFDTAELACMCDTWMYTNLATINVIQHGRYVASKFTLCCNNNTL